MDDFTRKERMIIERAWSALEYCTEQTTSLAIELADSLKYETGSRTAGRPRIWAKALMVDAFHEGRYGSTEDRRKWLYDAVGVSRGIRFCYLLAASNHKWRPEIENGTNLEVKTQAAVDVYKAVITRRNAA